MGDVIRTNTSLYLDLLRALSAIIVFLTHVQIVFFPHVSFGPFSWGREAVAVFFVLSGFVISYVVSNKEVDGRGYSAARLTRLYPVAVIAILVTLFADAISRMGGAHHFSWLNTLEDAYRHFDAEALARSLTFSNQLWFQHIVFGSNEPYWSLGFEVPYYVLFGFVSYLPNKSKYLACLVWALLCGPKIILYLPLWFMGVFCQRFLTSYRVQSPAIGVVSYIFSLIMFVGVKAILGKSATDMYHIHGLAEEFVNFLYFSLIGISIVINIVAADALMASRDIFPKKAVASVRWFAGGSFTLYLVHQPLAIMVAALLLPIESNGVFSGFYALIVFVLAMLLAEIGERKKYVYAPFFRRALASANAAAPPVKEVSVQPSDFNRSGNPTSSPQLVAQRSCESHGRSRQ
jgi:peptidoglycan/LPS O-acetylase OafA/YrhL